MFSMLGLLVVVAVVALLVKKQLTPVALPSATGSPAVASTPQQQSQQLQQQVRQAVEGAMQQARPMPEDK